MPSCLTIFERSAQYLIKYCVCRSGGIGRRGGLKIPCPQGRAGSTPAFGIWILRIFKKCYLLSNPKISSKNSQLGGHTGDRFTSLKPHKISFCRNLPFRLVDIFNFSSNIYVKKKCFLDNQVLTLLDMCR